MKYFSLFSGCGGFDLALTRLGHECVGCSEIDKYALAVYRKHFPSHKEYGDADKLVDLPDFDMLAAGFPCPDFSIAGNRVGLEGAQGSLFHHITRILRHKRPRYFLLENVKGLLSVRHGKDFAQILGGLTACGYLLQWEILNSKHFSVPQSRQRIFIIGHLGGTRRPEVFPLAEANGAHHETGKDRASVVTQTVTGQNTNARGTYIVSNCIDANYHRGWLDHGQRTMIRVNPDEPNQSKYAYSADGIAPTLQSGGSASGTSSSSSPYIMQVNPQVHQDYRVNLSKGISPTLNSSRGGGSAKHPLILHEQSRIRRLTALECERLQAFPCNFTQYGVDEHGQQIKISDTQRYRMIGNAVTVSVVEAIMEEFDECKG